MRIMQDNQEYVVEEEHIVLSFGKKMVYIRDIFNNSYMLSKSLTQYKLIDVNLILYFVYLDF